MAPDVLSLRHPFYDRPWGQSFLVLIVVLLVSRSTLTFVSMDPLTDMQATVLSWPTTIGIVLAGVAVMSLSKRTPMANNWRPPSSAVAVHAGLVGGTCGAVLVGLDLGFGLGIPHVGFPQSLAFYAYGAIAQELLLRLLPLSGIVWLAALLTSEERHHRWAFWAVGVIVALFEPVGILGLVSPLRLLPRGLVFATVLGANLAAVELYRRYGLYAAVSERVSLYLVWHVLFVG
jgi:hypothetical protein